MVNRIADADIVLTNKVIINKEVMDKASSLKMISILATGTNNVDLEYAKTKNIVVQNVTDYSTDSVAQHTFTCLFALLGKIAYQDTYVKSKKYAKSTIFTHLNHPFTEIKGKKFGVIGLGNIGKHVASIAKAFGCEIIYYSTSGNNNFDQYKRVEFDELLSSSDIISIHAPLNDATKNLISLKEIERMKSTAVIINMGRGGIINEFDLASALKKKKIFGACLDVYEQEPMSNCNPLLEPELFDRLILTPHIAWGSIEARQKLWQKTLINVRKFIQNG